METAEVSEHLLKVYQFVSAADHWVTAREIADGADVALRTARAHALRLVRAGVFEQAEVFPAHRYRKSSMAAVRNLDLIQRLHQANEVFARQ